MSHAGIYKAHPLRVNPRLRMLKTVYKANIDIVHIQRDEASTLFTATERSVQSEDSQMGGPNDTQSDVLFQVPRLPAQEDLSVYIPCQPYVTCIRK